MSHFKATAAALLGFLVVCAAPPAVHAAPERSYWERLLHFDGKQSRVVSDEFFVSPSGRKDPQAEMAAFRTLLHGADGEEVACNFPARYSWLRRREPDLPFVDLATCDELQRFLASFQLEQLYLGFVSEFVDAPASAFGHILLVFRNPDTPLPLADAVHFAAVTSRDSYLRYAYKGLSGKFDGFFIRDPFYRKLNEYGVHEQRAIHLYRLNLDRDAIRSVVLHLFELRKARFKYYFVRENCAFQIAELLGIALPEQDRGFSSAHAVLPIEVVRRHADLVVEREAVIPSLRRAEKLMSSLSSAELAAIRDVMALRAPPDEGMPDPVKEVLAISYEYAFRRRRVVYGNYDAVRSLGYRPTPIVDALPDPAAADAAGRIQLGLHSDGTRNSLLLGYRPLQRDIYSPQREALLESELSVLDTRLLVGEHELRLKSLDVVKVRSLPPRTVMQQTLSWALYAGVNRYNDSERLRAQAEFGIGQNFAPRGSAMEAAVSAGVQAGPEGGAYLKPSATALTYVGPVKVGAQASQRFFADRAYRQWELFASAKSGGTGYWTLQRERAAGRHPALSLSFHWPL